jgi:hypothetical protein
MRKKMLLTRIYEDDLEFEMECLKMYKRILQYFKKQMESSSTLEADMKLLKAPPGQRRGGVRLTSNETMAVTYRVERKKIIRSQLELIRYLMKVV